MSPLAWSGEPVWDGHYYDFAAKRIAGGFGYSDDLVVGGQTVWHPWCHYPVGYSAFLALFYRLLGASHVVAATVDSLTGAGLAVVTWLLAREALTATRARIAGLLVALHPGMILYAALVMTEPLAALLTLLAFTWLAVRDRRPARGMVLRRAHPRRRGARSAAGRSSASRFSPSSSPRSRASGRSGRSSPSARSRSSPSSRGRRATAA